MPAPTWPELQDYETQFDAAHASILSVFEAAPYDFTLFPQQSVASLSAPRLEHQFTLGEPSGPTGEIQTRMLAGAAGRAVAFKFSMRYLFVFDRTKLAAGAAGFRGVFRELLAPPAPGAEGAFSTTTLPWLEITALNEISARRGYLPGKENEKMLDIWESNWAGIFTLRADSVPA